MDEIEAVKILEQRMVRAKDGPCIVSVIRTMTTVVDSVVSIGSDQFPCRQEVKLCDAFRLGDVFSYPQAMRKVGFRLNDAANDGIEYVAIEIDDKWYGLGVLTHYGIRIVVG